MNIDTALANVDALSQPQAAALTTALIARHKLLKDQHAARITALVTVGSTVKIRDNMRPRTLCGLVGVVRSMNGKAAEITLDERSAAEHRQQQLDGIPLAALEALDSAQSFAQVVDFFLNHATIEDLTTLNGARKRRIEALASGLTTGDQVVVIDVRPKFLAGLIGAVASVNKTDRTCEVLLDEASTDRVRWLRSPKYTVADTTKRYPLRLRFTQVLITGRG
ncbi:hypothetical protein [Alloactinosynnema sp. L-07]|uniref:hypothetical protein n=1 Tax=Alloactinosynnema sp. L-07 TaxID=1653480 RepID=UPI00065F0840|nr:hypothetical protein [Alloactinosynnema sp. L-07]CRK56974.1 hypothetical protein [Alloactinosynnema sp. L-07]